MIFKGILTFVLCTTLTIKLSTQLLFACLGRGYLSPLAYYFAIIFSQLGSALNCGNIFHGRSCTRK